MSRFSEHWLGLREAADHRCRHDFSALLHAPTPTPTPTPTRWIVADLGCGSGSNLRFLHPRLGGVQHWTCIDNDAELLEALRGEARLRGDSVITAHTDLSADPAAAILAAFSACSDPGGEAAGTRLVTASALLDLVSDHWLEALGAVCAQTRAAVWFALSYDGRIEFSPAHAEDVRLRTLVNDHQLTDKGFGPALGPRAHQRAREILRRAGYSTWESPSDWHLSAADTPLLGELLSGWLNAAREQAHSHSALRNWAAQRLMQLDRGQLEVRVGHMDLLALPGASA